MAATQLPKINDVFSRCEGSRQITDYGKRLSSSQKTDASIKGAIERAITNDDVLRAIESYEIDVQVRNGVVYLHGHIVSTTSQGRIENAIRSISGIQGIQNNLVLDDKLTLAVATSLGELEHSYDCKFFTGASHGVISLNGNVSDENVKLLAEQRVSSHPNVRGVINNVHVIGGEQAQHNQRFLQPMIGETIYFLDGVTGVVKQVIINPNNRRVVGMTIRGLFVDRKEVKSLNKAEVQSAERLVILSMDLLRHLTRVSGFLNISSAESSRYLDFDSASFCVPNVDWTPPFPYCPEDVMFPVERREVEDQMLEQLPPPWVVTSPEQVLWEQLLADDSLGG